ncbi:MAG: methyltransferase domain-containing protein [Candidatus Omnitrophica bacterium]|nr:methyltransferase domain-containing protein [Candidatus Omnitrophota bacterium]
MTEITNTGERILLAKETPLMIARHFCAYQYALDYCCAKVVLDIGSGDGYGSHYLSSVAKSVTGLDYSAEAVQYAREKYARVNLTYRQLDVKNLHTISDKFEAICCFQVIEHLTDTDSFLKNIRSLLLPGGSFIVSTCNIKDSSPGQTTPANKFHVKEYTYQEFKGLLEIYYGSVSIVGLKRTARLNFFHRLKKIGLLKQLYINAGPESFKIARGNLEDSLDFIAVCKS